MFDLDTTTMTMLLAFLTTGALVYGAIQLFMSLRSPEEKRVQRRLADDLGISEKRGSEQNTLVRSSNADVKSAMVQWLKASQQGMSFQKLCDQAAISWSPQKILLSIGFAVAGVFLVGLPLRISPFALLLTNMMIVLLPIAAIVIMKNRRLAKFNTQLPEVLELLSQCLRAGHSLQSGMQLVAEQLPDPAGVEFARITAEQSLGIPLEEAMDHAAERVGVLDLRMFVTAVHIQRQTGGDLTELMDKLGYVIRDRMQILGQVKALTAEGRLSGWILSALPIVVLLMLFQVNPGYLDVLLHTPIGKAMMAIAVVMQITGMLLIRKIVNIKV